MLSLVLKIGQMVFWNQLGRNLIVLNEVKARRLAPQYKITAAWYSPASTRLFLSSIKAAISLKAAKIILEKCWRGNMKGSRRV